MAGKLGRELRVPTHRGLGALALGASSRPDRYPLCVPAGFDDIVGLIALSRATRIGHFALRTNWRLPTTVFGYGARNVTQSHFAKSLYQAPMPNPIQRFAAGGAGGRFPRGINSASSNAA